MKRRTLVLRKVGNTVVLTIPQDFLEDMLWKQGDRVMLTLEADANSFRVERADG